MPSLDVNGLTDTKTRENGSWGQQKKQKRNYEALNGKKYKSEAEYIRIERKGE
ncbi:MAG: hypothetical protein [Arizlama microvirus]|nr:MAG: hypothetical protein [Arizlama microvirus]